MSAKGRMQAKTATENLGRLMAIEAVLAALSNSMQHALPNSHHIYDVNEANGDSVEQTIDDIREQLNAARMAVARLKDLMEYVVQCADRKEN